MTVRVTHVADGLGVGGAEMMLARLVAATGDRFEHRVVSLTGLGDVGRGMADGGVPVEALDLEPRPRDAPGLARLVPLLRRHRPHVVQTWLYQADLAGGLAARLLRIPVAWGIHRVDLDPARTKTRMRWNVRANARLSRWVPHRIVCCSASAAEMHAGLGYDRDRMVVIPNGFSVPSPAPAREAARAVRAELGAGAADLLVGVVARWDPQKDHRNFVRAAGAVARRRPDVTFVLCGGGVDPGNATLRSWLRAEGIDERTRLLGLRHDVAAVQAALDVAVSPSAGEALPMAVGEAMALAVPCVVTDVGDSAELVGDAGRVVAPGDPVALAAAVEEVLGLGAEGRAAMGERGRRRVEAEYSLSVTADRYAALWSDLAAGGSRG